MNDFSDPLKQIVQTKVGNKVILVILYKSLIHLAHQCHKKCYNMDILRQTACMDVNPITGHNFVFNCTAVGRS